MILAVVFYAAVLVVCFSMLQSAVLMIIARRSLREPGRQDETAAPVAVSVLIPCFNERKVLRQTLDSVLASEGVELTRVICVDDGSTDGTIDVMLAAKRDYGAKVVVLRQENMGKATALNHGLTAVQTSVFVAVDADTQLTPWALAKLLPHFADDDVAAVSGQMLVGNTCPRNRSVHIAQQREYEIANNIDRRAFSRLGLVTVVPGAIGAFRSGAVLAVGGFPTGTLAEDAYLTFKLLLQGHKVVHEPSAIVLTEAPDTVRGLFKQRVRWATGKLQVALRTGRQALRRSGKLRLLWGQTFLNQAVLPLLTVFTPIGIAVVPASLALAAAHGAAPPPGMSAAAAVVVAIAVLLTRLGHSVLVSGFARAADVTARTATGLPLTRPGPVSLVLIPVVACAACWAAWFALITGRRHAWNKLDRTGDVRLVPHQADGHEPVEPMRPLRLDA
jgi:cellulose synthase/poly-beta-1,6-N-acetylglucosamine synthase-like glycosyltransferase